MSKKQKKGRVYETNIEDKEHHFDYCFEFDTNAKSRFLRLSFDRLSKFQNFQLFILQYTRKKPTKMYILVISLFTG